MIPALADDTCGTVALGDRHVRRLGYGAMRLTGSGVWGPPDRPDDAVALLRHAVDRGVDFIDTAAAYGPGDNERVIADALHPYDGVLIATKCGLAREGPGQWSPSGSPDQLRRDCEASLRNLRVDRLDLLQLHTPDPTVDFADQIGTLAELVAEGKVAHIGLSNVTVDQLDQATTIADIVSVQNRYNLAERTDDDVLTRCEQLGVAFIPWYPLAPADGFGTFQNPLDEIAAAHGVGHRTVALAWLLARSPVVLPIPGTSSHEHFDQNLAAAFLELTEGELDRLTAHSPETGALLGQLSGGPLSEERRAVLEPTRSRLRAIVDRLKFWD